MRSFAGIALVGFVLSRPAFGDPVPPVPKEATADRTRRTQALARDAHKELLAGGILSGIAIVGAVLTGVGIYLVSHACTPTSDYPECFAPGASMALAGGLVGGTTLLAGIVQLAIGAHDRAVARRLGAVSIALRPGQIGSGVFVGWRAEW